jgi:hypothetical protein
MSTLHLSPTPVALHGLPPGVVLLTTAPPASREDQQHRGHHLEHRPMLTACRRGLDILHEPGVAVAAVHEADNPDGTWLALEFALHLADFRRSHALQPVVCLTAANRPELLPDMATRLPHLAEVMDVEDRVTDHVVWELMTAHDATAWLGSPLPDQRWFENHLPALLTMYKLLREERLPHHPACAALMARLADRYLSIRFAYQNRALIAEVLAIINVKQVGHQLAGVADDRR